MRLKDIPTEELRRALVATEAAAGVDSVDARILRRELEARREAARRRKGRARG